MASFAALFVRLACTVLVTAPKGIGKMKPGIERSAKNGLKREKVTISPVHGDYYPSDRDSAFLLQLVTEYFSKHVHRDLVRRSLFCKGGIVVLNFSDITAEDDLYSSMRRTIQHIDEVLKDERLKGKRYIVNTLWAEHMRNGDRDSNTPFLP
uniref:Uncharacterized protein n=1 Tax=Moniliophthora roreri TaxID=221103 RepID=A0A0W0FVH4_MONRR